MIKNFRKSWVPPEEETSELRRRLEPGKLKITNPYYMNETQDTQDQVKEERRRELEEVRKSFAEKKENENLNIERSYKVMPG